MSREKTLEEVRMGFLCEMSRLVNYWNNVSDRDCKEKLEGLVHSILTKIDGCGGGCGYILAPLPNPEDKQDCIENEQDYYPENHEANVNCDISGGLHEHWGKFIR